MGPGLHLRQPRGPGTVGDDVGRAGGHAIAQVGRGRGRHTKGGGVGGGGVATQPPHTRVGAHLLCRSRTHPRQPPHPSARPPAWGAAALAGAATRCCARPYSSHKLPAPCPSRNPAVVLGGSCPASPSPPPAARPAWKPPERFRASMQPPCCPLAPAPQPCNSVTSSPPPHTHTMGNASGHLQPYMVTFCPVDVAAGPAPFRDLARARPVRSATTCWLLQPRLAW